MSFQLEAACISHNGRILQHNEDNFLFSDNSLPEEHGSMPRPLTCRCESGPPQLFAVLDGMGGEANGQLASFLAVQQLREMLSEVGTPDLSTELFSQLIQCMNQRIFQQADLDGTRMGSTAVMLGFQGQQVWTCNLGDSRAYRLRAGSLTQLTVDHVETIPPFMQKHRRKPRLNQCLGSDPMELRLEPHIAAEMMQAEDIYLLCSDGLTDVVPEQTLRELLQTGETMEQCTEMLLACALEHGGRDNITVITIRVTAGREA